MFAARDLLMCSGGMPPQNYLMNFSSGPTTFPPQLSLTYKNNDGSGLTIGTVPSSSNYTKSSGTYQGVYWQNPSSSTVDNTVLGIYQERTATDFQEIAAATDGMPGGITSTVIRPAPFAINPSPSGWPLPANDAISAINMACLRATADGSSWVGAGLMMTGNFNAYVFLGYWQSNAFNVLASAQTSANTLATAVENGLLIYAGMNGDPYSFAGYVGSSSTPILTYVDSAKVSPRGPSNRYWGFFSSTLFNQSYYPAPASYVRCLDSNQSVVGAPVPTGTPLPP